ncbi:hypothetical protein [Planotetraspora kaengkrachanensis]|uniref:Uncharacterized protein n=1 Tax=Planotetraspora kaengkrachanensis TaxID=575193 RepID=A0A8J3PXL1_9ACTN|nr:hypothetical protein [Planotetraspora kaengkrachanensis]GIG83012.1 hypothetical protein Pka01_61390 [Planotetraspora kaengkrachanensis]
MTRRQEIIRAVLFAALALAAPLVLLSFLLLDVPWGTLIMAAWLGAGVGISLWERRLQKIQADPRTPIEARPE